MTAPCLSKSHVVDSAREQRPAWANLERWPLLASALRGASYLGSYIRATAASALIFGWLGAGQAAAQDFSDFFVFGGSYSDAGSYLVDTGTGFESRRWTVNPALVWNQHVGANYDISVTSNLAINTVTAAVTTLGGNNYGQGGARVAELPGLFASNTLSLQGQVDAYLSSTGGRALPTALFSIEGGGNDILFQAQQIEDLNITPATARANILIAADNFASIAQQLTQAGARHLIVLNVHDFGATPIFNSSIAIIRDFFTSEPEAYNERLESRLRGFQSDNIIYVNTFAFLNELIENPGAYGFTNSTEAACDVGKASAIDCTTDTIKPGASATTFLFSDEVHPTGSGHLALSQYIQSILSAPGQIAQTAEAPVHVARGIYRTLDTRTWPGVRGGDGLSLYTNGDYATLDIGGDNGTGISDARAVSGHLGAERQFDGHHSLGVLFNYSDGNYDFSADSGDFDMEFYTATLYAGLQTGAAFSQLAGTIGTIDYDEIDREFDVFLGRRVNTGSTDGEYYGVRLLAGYDAKIGATTLTPIGALAYQKVEVDGYSEGQSDSSAMQFGNQTRELFLGSIGARLSHMTEIGWMAVQPLVDVRYYYDFKDQSRSVTAGLVNPGGILFSMPVLQPGRSWWSLSGGMSAEILPAWTLNATAGGLLGEDDTDGYWGNIGLTHRL